jgi:hypothetical protein
MNTRRGSVSFEVEGVAYMARLSTNAMVRFQDETGQNIIDAMGAMGGAAPDIKRLRALLWVSIEADLSQDAVGDLMDAMGFEEVGRILTEVSQAAFPDVKPADSTDAVGNEPAKRKAKGT